MDTLISLSRCKQDHFTNIAIEKCYNKTITKLFISIEQLIWK